MHTVGAFGFASAAYHWQRLAAAAVRLAHYLCELAAALYHLLYADDGLLLASGQGFWLRMLFLALCPRDSRDPFVLEESSGRDVVVLDWLPAGRGHVRERHRPQQGCLALRVGCCGSCVMVACRAAS